jgi:hypothetical protein
MLCTGQRCVTRLADLGRHRRSLSSYYRFLSDGKWRLRVLFQSLFRLTVREFMIVRLSLVLDDTLCVKWGRKIFGTGSFYDHVKRPRAGYIWGRNWVALAAVVQVGSVAWATVPFPKMRSDARLRNPKAPRQPKGKCGRKPKLGGYLPRPSTMARATRAFRTHRAQIYGKTVELLLREMVAYWPPLDCLVKAVISRAPRNRRRVAYLPSPIARALLRQETLRAPRRHRRPDHFLLRPPQQPRNRHSHRLPRRHGYRRGPKTCERTDIKRTLRPCRRHPVRCADGDSPEAPPPTFQSLSFREVKGQHATKNGWIVKNNRSLPEVRRAAGAERAERPT